MSLRSERRQRQETVDFCLAALDRLAERAAIDRVTEVTEFIRREGVLGEPSGHCIVPVPPYLQKAIPSLYLYAPLPTDLRQSEVWRIHLAPEVEALLVPVAARRVVMSLSARRSSALWKGMTLLQAAFKVWVHVEQGEDIRQEEIWWSTHRAIVEDELRVVKRIAGDIYQQELERLRRLYKTLGKDWLYRFLPPSVTSPELSAPFIEKKGEEVNPNEVNMLLWKLAHFELIAETEPNEMRGRELQINALRKLYEFQLQSVRSSSPTLS